MRKDKYRGLGGSLSAALLLFSWTALACRVGSVQSPTGFPTRPAVSASPSSVMESSNVYFNQEAGFSVTLPEGWRAAGPFEAVADQGWPHEVYAFGVSPSLDGGPGTSLVVVGKADGFSPEAFAAQQCGTCPPHPVESTQLGGVPAERIQVGGGGVPFSVEWTFVRTKGGIVGFSFRDPETLAPLPDVLESVVFE